MSRTLVEKYFRASSSTPLISISHLFEVYARTWKFHRKNCDGNLSLSLHGICTWLGLFAKGVNQSSVPTGKSVSFFSKIHCFPLNPCHTFCAITVVVIRAAWIRWEDSSINAWPQRNALCPQSQSAYPDWSISITENFSKMKMLPPQTYWIRNSHLCFNQPSTCSYCRIMFEN